MKSLSGRQADEQSDKWWRGLKTEWFKLEVLQDYTYVDDNPSLRAWLKGDHQRSLNLLKEDDDRDFTAECRQMLSNGVV